MARPPRITPPDSVHHAMARGNDGQLIFIRPGSWGIFLNILAETKHMLPFELFGYCLMPNHFHLLLQVRQTPLSRIMQRLLSTYAQYVNRVEKRAGHLFQGRFKSFPCHNDARILQVLRYIHLNPVRAGLAANPELWPWSGHGEYIGKNERGLISREFPLSLLSTDRRLAQEAYPRFISEYMDRVTSVPCKARDTPPHPKGTQGRVTLPDIGLLAVSCAEEGGISLTELQGTTRRRNVTAVRAAFIRRAFVAGLRTSELARFLNISHTAVRKTAFSRKKEQASVGAG